MTTTQRLYDMSRAELDQKIYEAITDVMLYPTKNGGEMAQRIALSIYDTRIKILKKHLKDILSVDFMTRDNELERDVFSAIVFWEKIKTI